jgi:hypothetical protein
VRSPFAVRLAPNPTGTCGLRQAPSPGGHTAAGRSSLASGNKRRQVPRSAGLAAVPRAFITADASESERETLWLPVAPESSVLWIGAGRISQLAAGVRPTPGLRARPRSSFRRVCLKSLSSLQVPRTFFRECLARGDSLTHLKNGVLRRVW